MVGGPAARPLPPRECRSEFVAYGTPTGDLPDPVARALDRLADEVARLQARLTELEAQAGGTAAGANGSDEEQPDTAGPEADGRRASA